MILLSSRRRPFPIWNFSGSVLVRCFGHLDEIQSDLRQAKLYHRSGESRRGNSPASIHR